MVLLSEKQDVQREASSLHRSLPSTGQQKLIIVLDISKKVRQLVENALEPEGYEVQGFSDGFEMLHWLTEHTSRVPDLVLLAIELPKMNGREVARRIRTKPQFAHTVIIMCSSQDEKMNAPAEIGANDFLTLPFQPYVLVALVRYHVGFCGK